MKRVYRLALLTGRCAVAGAVAALALQLAVGLFGVPRPIVRWMIGVDEAAPGEPATIVVLGGGGIPSESGLIRTYHAARLAGRHPAAELIVALPADDSPEDSSVGRMRDELVMRGVPAESIRMEHRGRNTHEQAVNIRAMLGQDALRQPLAIVTSPSHIRRSLLCFRKEGFEQATGFAAHGVGAEADLGAMTSMRYGFWSNQRLWIDYLREWCAMALYKLRGWT
jgi:uncharacterized SAM-binding protein YcdF (DUF218 family)